MVEPFCQNPYKEHNLMLMLLGFAKKKKTIVAAKLGADISDKPNVSAYIQRLNARPALAAAWQAGG